MTLTQHRRDDLPVAAGLESTGPTQPQTGVPAPEYTLSVLQVVPTAPALVWMVGAHGGAGETTLAGLHERFVPSGRHWILPSPQSPIAPCVVTARTSYHGLWYAQQVLQQWAGWPPTQLAPQLLGLVLLADAPGSLPRPLRDYARLVAGGAPRVWNIGWIPAWRTGDMGEQPPRQIIRLVNDLVFLLDQQQATA